ncbi:MAG: GNAT family N-acetyltransferase [Defluviitaleaceae bacterium]|nr:GNAT family N-acetyltransferase [Defluviitaleaceae bacterium]
MFFVEKDGLTIRRATSCDVGILGDWWRDGEVMEHAGFPNGLDIDDEGIAETIRSGNLFIVKVDETPVGEMNYRDKGDGIASIGIKICDPQAQEKGYGTKLLSMFIENLFNIGGFEKIILDTNLKNIRAQKTYEKLGFVKTEVRQGAWRNQLGELQSSVYYELSKENFEVKPDEV